MCMVPITGCLTNEANVTPEMEVPLWRNFNDKEIPSRLRRRARRPMRPLYRRGRHPFVSVRRRRTREGID